MTGRLTLRGYQETDVRRSLEEFGGKVILKHKQGLGKTLCSTRICEDDGVPHGPVVIVCRTHLIIQWIRHLRNEYPDAVIRSVVEERPGGRWRELGREAKMEMLTARPAADFYVLTFATIRRVKKVREAKGQRTVKEIWADVAEDKGWERRASARPAFEYPLPPCRSLIVDESQHLRGRKSQQYAGAYLLAVPTKARRAADRVVLVSTTPAWREQDDLYTQLRLLDPHRFTSYFEFIDRFCVTEETDYGSKVVGGRTKRIARLLEKYAITRDYADPDVRIAVPDLIEEEVVIGLSPGGQKAYDKVIAAMAATRRAGFSPGSGVSDFSRVTAHDKAKLAALDEVLEGIDEGDDYALFCKYQDTVELLSQHVGLPWFSGRTVAGSGINRYTRSEAIKRAGSFVGTIGCVNEGVDLSHLRTMIFYETDFTFGAMDQVRTRLKRWRQDSSTDPVRCIYIIAASTVDDVAYERSMQRGATEQEILDEIVARAKTAEGAHHAQ